MAARYSDHPRSRGVYSHPTNAGNVPAGSSPLARGLHDELGDPLTAVRIIPARAGFTQVRTRQTSADQDHPRSRGVYPVVGLIDLAADGIIPARAGFTDPPPHPRTWRSGIIPARAGFTVSAPSGSRAGRDHPRSRGVYWTVSTPSTTVVGSSPLARGLPARPTRAPQTAHGSSPLARGLRRRRGERPSRFRIIPARAGFTAFELVIIGLIPDHPRSRGVYVTVGQASMVPGGSSPLARGLRSPEP